MPGFFMLGAGLIFVDGVTHDVPPAAKARLIVTIQPIVAGLTQ